MIDPGLKGKIVLVPAGNNPQGIGAVSHCSGETNKIRRVL